MSHVFLLARKILFRRRGSVILAAGAVAVTIFLNIFATTVFGGVETGVLGDIADLRFGDVLVTYNRGEITTPDSQFVSTIVSNPAVQGVTPRLIVSSNINSSTLSGVKSKYGVETRKLKYWCPALLNSARTTTRVGTRSNVTFTSVSVPWAILSSGRVADSEAVCALVVADRFNPQACLRYQYGCTAGLRRCV